MTELSISAYGATDIGRVRETNEDSFGLASDNSALWWGVLCDGLGGEAAGEVASAMAVELFEKKIDGQTLPERGALERLIHEINAAIAEAGFSRADWRYMATTFVALIIDAETGKALIAHAGDSRLYRIRKDEIERLTRDHNVAEEVNRGVRNDDFTIPMGTGHEITRCLGLEHFRGPEIADITPEKGDRYILCSDGLTNVLRDSEILSNGQDCSAQEAVDEMIKLALSRGGPDNVTLIIADVT